MSEVENEVEAPEAVKLDIIRGRMPLPLVRAIKFGHPDLNDSQVADLYRTTSGKVSDVRKNRNFAYITQETVAFPSEQMDAATARIEAIGEDNETAAEDIRAVMAEANIHVADEAELAAFEEARQGSRKPRGKKAEDDDAEPEVEGLEDEVGQEDESGLEAEPEMDDLDDLLG